MSGASLAAELSAALGVEARERAHELEQREQLEPELRAQHLVEALRRLALHRAHRVQQRAVDRRRAEPAGGVKEASNWQSASGSSCRARE